MTTPRGVAPRYGLGLRVQRTDWGVPVVGHTGSTPGFASESAWFPADSLSVTVLYNSLGRTGPINLFLQLARAISPPTPPRTPPDAAAAARRP
jgi:hypothetical protein